METQLKEIKFATISMNCGNDRSGIEDKIFEILSGTAPPDILTIHAQEVNYGAELTRLATRLEGSAYRVMACQPRITATKLSAALTRKTGLCNFVIYNADKFDEPQENDPKIIVSPSVISNKGALISRVSLKPKTQEHPIYMALVAGHLDSFEEQSRLLEWQLIYNTIHPSAANWEGLVSITPDIIVGGFDANTRYETGKPVNPWQMATATPETQAYLSTLPLGRVLSSEEATYNKPQLQSIGEASSHPSSPRSVAEMSTIEGKRAGLADMGNLDITIWQSGQGETAPSISCQIIPFDGIELLHNLLKAQNYKFQRSN